jgi:hypothetical protein
MGATTLAPAAASARARTRAAVVPWHIYAVLFASTSIAVGVIWDISWHMTIGRDTFWTPAHLAIYLGGIVGGVANGIVVLRTTFAGTDDERARSVKFWGFSGPLGSWVTIWGAFAMVTSAPFDDWWHNAYGLDVEILSPPHTVLALGMIGVAFGALLSVLAYQNRATNEERTHFGWLYAYAAGIALTFHAIMVYEYSDRVLMHSSIMYRALCMALPVSLIATTRASSLKWGATATAGVYSLIMALMAWILPLFPATPMLGPIYQNVTHMVPLDFPLLLLAPAVVIDLARQRAEGRNSWTMSAVYGTIFCVVLVVAQFLFAYFLMSRASMNWFFATDNFPYMQPNTSSGVRRVFVAYDATEGAMRLGLLWSLGFAIVSSRVGLWWGDWMRRVQR